MTLSRKTLCVFYGLIGLVALIGTWGNNAQYLNLGFLGANVRFWQETLANPASRSITVDIFFLSLVVATWMLLESRRLKMRGAWLYVIFGVLIEISVTVPIFLINRARVLSKGDLSLAAGTLSRGDVIGLLIFLALVFQIRSDAVFLSVDNIRGILGLLPETALVAVGVTLLMICGEFDLSVGSVFALMPMTMAVLVVGGAPFWLAVVLGLGLCAAIGFLNGWISIRFGGR